MMGTKFKTAEEKFEYRIRKQHSIESCVILSIREKKCFSWETGLSFKKLKPEVERRRGKKVSDVRVYQAISLINRYGKRFGVYIRSGIGYVESDESNKRKIEHRYFIPKDEEDISDEKRDLDNKRIILNLKDEHIRFHEEITLPQEKRLSEIEYHET